MLTNSKINNIQKIIFLIVVFSSSCVSWKTDLENNGNVNIAIKNAVIDIIHTRKSFIKADSVFSIGFHSIDDNLLGVTIFSNPHKFFVVEGIKTDLTIYPTRYLEYDNKLFYWQDPNTELSNEVLDKLNQYHLIDSLKSIAFATLIDDDGSKGYYYYFCKNDLSVYKKVKGNLYYHWNDKKPNLRCDGSP